MWQETGNRVREGDPGRDAQRGDPGRESNPGPLQSLGTWVTRATNQAKQCPAYVHNLTVTNILLLTQTMIHKVVLMPDRPVRQNVVCAALDGGFSSVHCTESSTRKVCQVVPWVVLSAQQTTVAWCKPFEIMGSRAQWSSRILSESPRNLTKLRGSSFTIILLVRNHKTV